MWQMFSVMNQEKKLWAFSQKIPNMTQTYTLACIKTSILWLVKNGISKDKLTTTLTERKVFGPIDKSKVNFRKLISSQTIIAKQLVSFSLTLYEYYQYVIIVHSSILLIGHHSQYAVTGRVTQRQGGFRSAPRSDPNVNPLVWAAGQHSGASNIYGAKDRDTANRADAESSSVTWHVKPQ